MNSQYLKIAVLGVALNLTAQLSHASSSFEAKNTAAPVEKPTLIEKAIQQQNHAPVSKPTADEIKVMKTIQSTASSNFFATQNQRFSRFLQSLFQNNNS